MYEVRLHTILQNLTFDKILSHYFLFFFRIDLILYPPFHWASAFRCGIRVTINGINMEIFMKIVILSHSILYVIILNIYHYRVTFTKTFSQDSTLPD